MQNLTLKPIALATAFTLFTGSLAAEPITSDGCDPELKRALETAALAGAQTARDAIEKQLAYWPDEDPVIVIGDVSLTPRMRGVVDCLSDILNLDFSDLLDFSNIQGLIEKILGLLNITKLVCKILDRLISPYVDQAQAIIDGIDQRIDSIISGTGSAVGSIANDPSISSLREVRERLERLYGGGNR